MLYVYCSDSYKREREYIVDMLLKEFLGVEYFIVFGNRKNWRISNGSDKEIILPDIFFQTRKDKWLTKASLPRQPLAMWDTSETNMDCPIVHPKIPVIYGNQEAFRFSTSSIRLPIDIFGSAFFILTLYEEVVKEVRDKHGRFPAVASLAYQEGFLDRPIIDEYVEVLWSCMRHLWPRLRRKKREFVIIPTHDVDHLYLFPEIRGCRKVLRRVGGDLLYRRSIKAAINTAIGWSRYRFNGDKALEHDPFNTFEWIMENSERAGIKSRFYFMTHNENVPYGGNYSIDENMLPPILKLITERGHEVGFHPTGNSYNKEGSFAEQSEKLFSIMDRLKIRENVLGGRQHYLRWDQKITPCFWSKYGFQYDSTLGYADYAGFRCGTCHSYFLWDFDRSTRLSIKEQPLILMEGSLASEQYMNCSFNEAEFFIKTLKEACKCVNGNFVFLWHNSGLFLDHMRELYYACLSD